MFWDRHGGRLTTYLLIPFFPLFFPEIPFIDQLSLSFGKHLKEVVDWEEEAKKEDDQIASNIDLGPDVLDSTLHHHEGPRKGEGHYKIDHVS